MLTTLRQVAGELKASLEWDLAGVLLEENPDEAVKRLEALRARSPLTAGVGLSPEPAPESPPREMVRPKGAEVAEHFLKLTKDPEFQRTLEPVGAMGRFMTPSSSNSSAFQTRLREMEEEEIPAFAQRLLEAKDPLAARLAVCVAGGGKRYKEGADWARKALESVPDDPEILLALAARLDAKDPEARSAFLRALERIKVFHVPQEKEGWSWCGIQSNTRWSDAEVADAIAAFAERVKPPVLPIDWARTLESAIINREELAKLKNVQSVVLAAVRYRKPWREGEGDHPGWMSVLEALTAAGKAETAAVVAETLLSHPEGSLGRPGEFSEPAFPWINSSTGQVTGPAAEGWKYLLRAERNDPAGLANRLQVVSSVHAGDEQIAFAALLARGRERSLTVEDLKILDALKPAGRHRALAYASWLLPPDRLPVALLLEAWVAEAVVEFSDVGNGCRNFLQGIAYLDRLEAAGAKDSVQRCLPALVESIKTLGSFPDDFPQSLVQRLQRLGSSELVERMYRLLSERVLTKPEGADTYDDLEMVLKAYYDDPQAPTLPEEIAQRVTAALERAVAGQTPDAWARHYFLFRVASYAVADERWQPVLRQLLERQGPELFKSREGAGWRNIAAILGVLKSASLVPDVRARLIPTAEGQGTLTWAFLGIRPPPPPANSQRVSQAEKNNLRGWPALAKKLAGKFDAIILVSEAENGVAPTGETIVARVERFPANGEIPLTGLPRIGRLRILLFQREAPLAFTEVGPLGYNTLPLLFDTAQPPALRPHDPPGWQLLSEPRELTASASWLIDNATDRWPSGLALLLLDEDNEICAATELRPEVSAANPELAGFAGVFVKQHQFTSPRLNQKNQKTAVLRTVGPPRRLVLARSNQGNEKEDEKSDWGLLPRITVQEWPVEPGPPLAGKFEIVRLWHLPNQTGRAGAPALRLDPLQVAWYAEDRLHVLDLEKNAPPRELDLKLNPGFRFRSIFWHDARLHLHFQDPRDESTTLLLSLDTAQAEPVPDMYEFPGANINIQGPEAHNIPGVTLIYRKKELLGLLSPEGKYLQLAAALDPLAASPLYPQTLLTPTSLLCGSEGQQQFPILDWTDGTLRLVYANKIPENLPRNRDRSMLHSNQNGIVTDGSTQPPQTWLVPLQLTRLHAIDADRAVGMSIHRDGMSTSIVLMRRAAAPGK